ncbi:MAG: H(+)/Cl(-) exchange transporter ClcA, partial [Solirubrobacteraceae bacterium]
AELTGEFALILPIAVATIGATLSVHALGGRPIYSVLLERTLARTASPLSASAAPRSAPRSGA